MELKPVPHLSTFTVTENGEVKKDLQDVQRDLHDEIDVLKRSGLTQYRGGPYCVLWHRPADRRPLSYTI